MKQVLLLVLLLKATSVFSQEIIIQEIGLVNTDVAASTSPRLDESGDFCALLKVLTTNNNLQFKGNVVGTIIHKVNEYWVYLAKGSKDITIQSYDLIPKHIVFSNYLKNTKVLESKSTYKLVLQIDDNGKVIPFEDCKVDAEKGDRRAILNLGKCYYYSWGVDNNTNQAARCFEKAANKGSIEARYLLGKCYEKGIGTRHDTEEAAKHYKIAAKSGYPPALYALGDCYEEGKGVKQNRNKALEYYKEAEENGSLKAKSKLETITGQK